MGNKKNHYKPEARDGDNDGFVQDGTIWERPVGEVFTQTDEILEVIEAADAVEAGLVSHESPVETTAPAERPRTYVVKAGDSYASIGAKFKPADMRPFDYAQDILLANGGKALRPGVEILL